MGLLWSMYWPHSRHVQAVWTGSIAEQQLMAADYGRVGKAACRAHNLCGPSMQLFRRCHTSQPKDAGCSARPQSQCVQLSSMQAGRHVHRVNRNETQGVQRQQLLHTVPVASPVAATYQPATPIAHAVLLHVPVTDSPLGAVRRALLTQHPSGITFCLMGLVEGDWVETAGPLMCAACTHVGSHHLHCYMLVYVLVAGKPLGGVGRTLLLKHPSGITVGLMGLVEGDWVETLSTIEPEDVQWVHALEAKPVNPCCMVGSFYDGCCCCASIQRAQACLQQRPPISQVKWPSTAYTLHCVAAGTLTL